MRVPIWLKKRWRRALKWVLLAVAGSVIALLVGHYGEEVLGGEKEDDPASGIRIVAESSLVNPARDDTAPEEYVCLVNEAEEGVSLTSWKLYDSAGRVNEFGRYSLEPGGSVRVHPGGRPRSDTSLDVYGSGNRPRWTNSGDTIVLRNAADESVESQSYPSRPDGEVGDNCGPRRRRDWDCTAFLSQPQAQSFYLSHQPARDPYGLDADGDGLACES